MSISRGLLFAVFRAIDEIYIYELTLSLVTLVLIPARGSLVEGNASEIEIKALPHYFTLFKLGNSIFFFFEV